MYNMYRYTALCFCLLAFVVGALGRCGGTGRRLGIGRELQQVSDGCVVEWGVDYKNTDPLNDGYNTIVSKPEECCDICINTPGCERWVMIMADTRYHVKGECWLKTADVEKTDCVVCAGGVKPKTLQPAISERIGLPDEGCLVLPGMDFKGGDMGDGIPVNSDDECCSLCQGERRCKAWSRGADGRCWLKSVQNVISICEECISSGIVESRQSPQDLDALTAILRLVKDSPKTDEGLKGAIDGFLGRVESIGG